MISKVCTVKNNTGYGVRDLSLILRIPERTIHSYFSGERKAPQSFIDSLEDLRRRDREFMEGIAARTDQALDKQFGPGGKFLSDRTAGDD